MDLFIVNSTVDSPCALLVDTAASVRGTAETAALWPRLQPRETHTASTPSIERHEPSTPSTRRLLDTNNALDVPAQKTNFSRRAGGGGPPGGFGGGFGGATSVSHVNAATTV